MKIKNKKRFNSYIIKRDNAYQNEIVKCKCGHSLFLPYIEPVKICSFCGSIVYKNKKAEFVYRLSSKRISLNED
jgi:hypothetical protein